METQTIKNPSTCIGLFSDIAQADQAVCALLQSGISREEIGILCAEEYREKYFPGLPKGELPGGSPGKAILPGGVIGAAIGGLALAGASVIFAGLPLLAIGSVLIGGGAIAGSFTGAMASLGYDQKTADECRHALEEGRILVAVKPHGAEPLDELKQAAHIMEECGAEEVLEPLLK